MNKVFTTIAASLLLTTAGFAADAAAGKTDYDKSCKSCHGPTGTANPAIAKMMKVDMNDLGSSAVQAQSDAALAAIISGGKGKMKPVASANAANVVAYLRTLKK
jgi:mono/diheme cytochrome c family protein